MASNVTVSSLAAYRERASHFFSVFLGKPHDFPWEFVRAFVTNGLPDLDKEYAMKLERLERVFEARHKFVHETNIYAVDELELLGDDLFECVDDALSLMKQFEKQYEHILMSPKYAALKKMRDSKMQSAGI